MTVSSSTDPTGPGFDVLNDPAQYEYPTQIDPDTGIPFIENPGDLGYVIWAPIPGYRSAAGGGPDGSGQLYGPKRMGQPTYTGGRSSDGSPTRAKR